MALHPRKIPCAEKRAPAFIRVEYIDVDTGDLIHALSVETGVDLDHAVFGEMNPAKYKMVLTPFWLSEFG